MFKRGRNCEKFLKRKLERKLVAQLVAGKILKSAEIKFEVTASKYSMHKEKHSCEQLLCTYNHSGIKVIKLSK